MNINEFRRQHPRMRAHCLFRHEAEVSNELICGRWIFNSLICPYSDDFISHVANFKTETCPVQEDGFRQAMYVLKLADRGQLRYQLEDEVQYYSLATRLPCLLPNDG